MEKNIKCCSRCNISKPLEVFVDKKNFCKDCKNLRQRELRISKNTKILQETERLIGKNNKKCIYCEKIFPKTFFKCRKCFECKRIDDNKYKTNPIVKKKRLILRNTNPIYKIKHSLSSRIRLALKRKCEKTIDYLDCTIKEFNDWISFNFKNNFTFENYGTEWHIDHVIPVSNFDLSVKEQQYLAFNWRNTTPLSVKENLSKNKKILLSQIEQHYNTLLDYHKKNKLDLPQVYIDLFAKHLDAGNPLEPSLPLTIGNVREELG
jgi:hypothetical protein